MNALNQTTIPYKLQQQREKQSSERYGLEAEQIAEPGACIQEQSGSEESHDGSVHVAGGATVLNGVAVVVDPADSVVVVAVCVVVVDVVNTPPGKLAVDVVDTTALVVDTAGDDVVAAAVVVVVGVGAAFVEVVVAAVVEVGVRLLVVAGTVVVVVVVVVEAIVSFDEGSAPNGSSSPMEKHAEYCCKHGVRVSLRAYLFHIYSSPPQQLLYIHHKTHVDVAPDAGKV